MDHPAGPRYCRHRGVEAGGGERGGEGEGVGLVGTMREKIRGEENVGGIEERRNKSDTKIS